MLCVLTISRYAIMHARHDKHPFEKLLVTLAKLISVIIAVSITCCYLKKAVQGVLFAVVTKASLNCKEILWWRC